MKNKKAQVTLFIILAIFIVAVIVLIAYFSGNLKFLDSGFDSPEDFLQDCISNSIIEAEKIVLESNGYPEKDFNNTILYNSEKIPYLCSVSEFYSPCVPQEPAFLNKIRNIIQNKVARDTEECYSALDSEWGRKGYIVTKNASKTTVSINKDYIKVVVDKTIFLTKDEDSTKIQNPEVRHPSALYDLIKMAQTIVNYESTICEFNYLNWMKYDHKIFINRFTASDQTKIYTLRDSITNQQIKFATKSCALPAGI